MPPAFILSQDQTLHCKKFDTPRRLRREDFLSRGHSDPQKDRMLNCCQSHHIALLGFQRAVFVRTCPLIYMSFCFCQALSRRFFAFSANFSSKTWMLSKQRISIGFLMNEPLLYHRYRKMQMNLHIYFSVKTTRCSLAICKRCDTKRQFITIDIQSPAKTA